jgi:hypothetical protein
VEDSRADDLNVDDVVIRGARAAGYRAGLVGTSWLSEDGNLICASGGNQGGEGEGAVSFNGEVIAAIVLQDKAAARFGEPSNRAADGEGAGGACNLNVADVGIGGAAAIRYRTSLTMSALSNYF